MTIREIAEDAVQECRELVVRDNAATHSITDEQARDKFLRAFVEMLRQAGQDRINECFDYDDDASFRALADRIEKEIEA